MKAIWQVDQWNRTVKQAIDEFCATYWFTPRNHIKMKEAGAFKMRGGLATYQCKVNNEATPATFEVYKIA